MTLDPGLVSDAVARNDAGEVRRLLRDATEADRRAGATALSSMFGGPRVSPPEPMAISLHDLLQFATSRAMETMSGAAEHSAAERERDDWNRVRTGAAFLAAQLGVVSAAGAAIRAAADWDPSDQRPTDEDLDAIAGVLADRQPDWLAKLVDRILRDDFGFALWPLAHRLVRLGVIDRPQIAEYATRLPWSIGWAGVTDHSASRRARAIHDELLADPGLLDDEVWRLFTVRDAAWRLGKDWADALATLAAEGHLDRDRLIDAALDAFTRDFPPNRVGWYAIVYDRLGPTVGETAARTGRYLSLLGVGAKPAITLAQRALDTLVSAGRVAAAVVLDASAPALLFPQKSVALAQLKLIGRVAMKDPVADAAAMTAAAQAFAHRREDVQEAALALIRKHGVPGEPHRAQIAAHVEALSPALLGEAAALGLGALAGAGAGFGDGPAVEVSQAASEQLGRLAARIDALPAQAAAELLVLREAARLKYLPGPVAVSPSAGHLLAEPVTDPEELVQLFARLMEDASDALAVERAMAGAVRLAALPDGDRARLAAPLLSRARKRAEEDHYGPFAGDQITADVARLVLAWGAGWTMAAAEPSGACGREYHETVSRNGEARTMAGLLTARAFEAAALIASGLPLRLLAEPEFERGAISQDRLLERLEWWQVSGVRPGRYDLEVALLRLHPGASDELWSALAAMDLDTAEAARNSHAACTRPLVIEPVIGVPAPLLLRESYDEPLVLARVIDGQKGAAAGSRSWALLTVPLSDPLRTHKLMYGERWTIRHYDPVVAAWPLLCPWQPELAAAHLLRPLSDGLTPGPTAASTAVRCLAHPRHPLGIAGHLALVTGLASGEPDTRIAAADVWSLAALDGRLDPALAADALAAGATGGAYKLNRLADGLQHAAREPLAGYRAIEAIFGAASALADAKSANLHLLFELAARIGAVTGLPELPATVAALAARRTNTKLTSAAQRLARDPESARRSDAWEVVAQALGAHVTRAEQRG